ncbi:MAG: hypothetical protein ABIN01_13455 [Ferruginibacter sp.]
MSYLIKKVQAKDFKCKAPDWSKILRWKIFFYSSFMGYTSIVGQQGPTTASGIVDYFNTWQLWPNEYNSTNGS